MPLNDLLFNNSLQLCSSFLCWGKIGLHYYICFSSAFLLLFESKLSYQAYHKGSRSHPHILLDLLLSLCPPSPTFNSRCPWFRYRMVLYVSLLYLLLSHIWVNKILLVFLFSIIKILNYWFDMLTLN